MFDGSPENWWKERVDAYTKLMQKKPKKFKGNPSDEKSGTSSSSEESSLTSDFDKMLSMWLILRFKIH